MTALLVGKFSMVLLSMSHPVGTFCCLPLPKVHSKPIYQCANLPLSRRTTKIMRWNLIERPYFRTPLSTCFSLLSVDYGELSWIVGCPSAMLCGVSWTHAVKFIASFFCATLSPDGVPYIICNLVGWGRKIPSFAPEKGAKKENVGHTEKKLPRFFGNLPRFGLFSPIFVE